MSRMRQHFEQVRSMRESSLKAQAAAGGTVAVTESALTEAHRMTTLLAAQKSRLHTIQSTEAKIKAKALMLPEFLPYVEGVIAADAGGEDPVLMTVMVWAVDLGETTLALRCLDYALRHALSMPEPFKRSAGATVVEDLADQVLTAVKVGDGNTLALVEALAASVQRTADVDMHDAIRAKAHKALGRAYLDTDPAAAAEHFKLALGYDPTCRVSGDLKKAEKSAMQAATEAE